MSNSNNKCYNLFLDDVRMPTDAFSYTRNKMYYENEWIIVRDYDSFVNTIKSNGLPEWLSFDHDLGDSAYIEWLDNTSNNGIINYNNIKEKTGLDCVKWTVDYCIENNFSFPNYLLHTQNPVGKENMKKYIQNFIIFQSQKNII